MREIFYILILLFIIRVEIPAQEKTVHGTGRVFGSNLTAEQAWAEALNDARADAIKIAAGISIQSESFSTAFESLSSGNQSSKSQEFFSSLTSSSTMARIVNEKILSERIDAATNNKIPIYIVEIEAVVSTEKGLRDPNFQLKLDLHGDTFSARKELSKSDELQLDFHANVDCYLYLFNFLSNDSVQLVLPNKYIHNNFYRAGTNGQELKQSVIDRGMKFRVILSPGKESTIEHLYLVALKKKVDFSSKNLSIDGSGIIPTYKAAFTDLQGWLLRIPLDERVEVTKSYQIKKAD